MGTANWLPKQRHCRLKVAALSLNARRWCISAHTQRLSDHRFVPSKPSYQEKKVVFVLLWLHLWGMVPFVYLLWQYKPNKAWGWLKGPFLKGDKRPLRERNSAPVCKKHLVQFLFPASFWSQLPTITDAIRLPSNCWQTIFFLIGSTWVGKMQVADSHICLRLVCGMQVFIAGVFQVPWCLSCLVSVPAL